VQSEYLDTAINPAPWPTRDAPPERGGRPLLGHERKVFLTAPGTLISVNQVVPNDDIIGAWQPP
jgi:hypothetical protein